MKRTTPHKGTHMPVDKQPDIWALIFEQTPTTLRWIFGVLTLGVFTLLSVLYRWHRADMRRIESRIDNLEGRLDHHMGEQTRILTQIASNTRSR